VLKRWALYVVSVALGLAVVGALLGAFVLALLYPTLPSLESLTDYQPKVPLRVLSAEGELIGEFGEERRAVVRISEVPERMKQAILAAEDERFYQHGGVDYLSVLRAAYANLVSGSQQGAGTITMQVARNFFLTREKTITRKLREVLLAWKIEANLRKDDILELYVNQIFLGQRAYGFAAASQIYFGKPLRDVSVAEAAMLAGLPKAPSAFNPVSNPKRARTSASSPMPSWRRPRPSRSPCSAASATCCRCMRSSPPRWRARSSSRPTGRRRTRGGSPCGLQSAPPIRKPRTRPFAAASSTTTAGTATAVRRRS
jgi:penicillin-binding protein 1A